MSDGLLSRWARRKQAVRAAERAEPPRLIEPTGSEAARLAEASPVAVPDPTPEEADALAEMIARLPKLEDVTAQTDLTQFLRAGIPSALRNAALRRMWSVDPGIRDFVSEAREYAYDWNTPGGVPGLGPMLPTDDIKAMVERVMTGHAPAAKPTEPPVEAAEADVIEAVATAPSESEAEAGQPMLDHGLDPADVHVAEPAPHPSVNPVDTFQSPAIVSRLRRHGGAMPG